jgi:hypothetical protein
MDQGEPGPDYPPEAVLALARMIWGDVPEDAKVQFFWSRHYATLSWDWRRHAFAASEHRVATVNRRMVNGATWVPDLGSDAKGEAGEANLRSSRRQALARCIQAALSTGK